MSFALTTEQIRNRTKTVTQRVGWKTARPGDVVQPVVKGQGIPKGCTVEKIGGPIRFVDVWRGPLDRMLGRYEEFAASDEAKLEGFPHLTSEEFVAMFCEHNGCAPDTEITRIEFEYVEEGAPR